MKSDIRFSIQVPGTALLWKDVAAFARGVRVTGDESKCPAIKGVVAEYRKAVLFGALEARRLRRLEQQQTASRRYRQKRRTDASRAGEEAQSRRVRPN